MADFANKLKKAKEYLEPVLSKEGKAKLKDVNGMSDLQALVNDYTNLVAELKMRAATGSDELDKATELGAAVAKLKKAKKLLFESYKKYQNELNEHWQKIVEANAEAIAEIDHSLEEFRKKQFEESYHDIQQGIETHAIGLEHTLEELRKVNAEMEQANRQLATQKGEIAPAFGKVMGDLMKQVFNDDFVKLLPKALQMSPIPSPTPRVDDYLKRVTQRKEKGQTEDLTTNVADLLEELNNYISQTFSQYKNQLHQLKELQQLQNYQEMLNQINQAEIAARESARRAMQNAQKKEGTLDHLFKATAAYCVIHANKKKLEAKAVQLKQHIVNTASPKELGLISKTLKIFHSGAELFSGLLNRGKKSELAKEAKKSLIDMNPFSTKLTRK